MKTLPRTLFILAGLGLIATAAFDLANPLPAADQVAISPVGDPMPPAPTITYDPSKTTEYVLPGKTNAVSTDTISVYVQDQSQPVMEVRGLDAMAFYAGAGHEEKYGRPQKISEVHVSIWTADGQEWQARWEKAVK